MRRHLLVLLTVVALAFATSGTAFAYPSDDQPAAIGSPALLGLIGNDDVFSTADLTTLLAPVAPMAGTTNGTQHYGPYTTLDSDSGCNVTQWNTETFDRHFTVRDNGDDTFTVVEQFKNGDFVTVGSQSPGERCPENNDPTGVATLDPNITGSMHGYFIITNVGPQTSHDPNCNATTHDNTGCNTTTFIDTHFTPCYALSVCTVPTFFFHYAAGDQGLVEHEWTNASADRGGNRGDIASSDPD